MKSYGIIYALINKVNGKVYIGQTTVSLEKRLTGHVTDSKRKKNGKFLDTKLAKALRKYGMDSFDKKILEHCYTNQDGLDRLEIFYINKFNSMKIGYNIRHGGSRGPIAESTKEKLRKIKSTPGYIENMSKKMTGRKLTEEHRAAISIARLGKPSSRRGAIQGPEPMKRRLSKSNTIKCMETGQIFYSIREMERILDINRTPIIRYLKGSINHIKGYTFIVCLSDARKKY